MDSISQYVNKPSGQVLKAIRSTTPPKGTWLHVQPRNPDIKDFFGTFETFAVMENGEVRWIILPMVENRELGGVKQAVLASQCFEAGAEEVEEARKSLLTQF